MQLTRDELARFEKEGYLFFPGRFSPEEAAVLKRHADAVYAMQREEVWRESSGAARTAFAAHTYDEAHRRLGPGGLLLRDFLYETAADPGVRTVNLVTAPAWSDRWHMGQEASVDLWIYGATRRGRLLLAEHALEDRARAVLHRGTPRLAS